MICPSSHSSQVADVRIPCSVHIYDIVFPEIKIAAVYIKLIKCMLLKSVRAASIIHDLEICYVVRLLIYVLWDYFN